MKPYRMGNGDDDEENVTLITEQERKGREVNFGSLYTSSQEKQHSISTLQQDQASLTTEIEDFQLSSKTLIAVALYFIAYIVLGIVSFSFILEPTWTVVDSIYFSVVTFTTVGYGDFHPSSNASKVFVMFYALYGVSILGLGVGILGNYLINVHVETRNSIKRRVFKQFINQVTPTSSPTGRNYSENVELTENGSNNMFSSTATSNEQDINTNNSSIWIDAFNVLRLRLESRTLGILIVVAILYSMSTSDISILDTLYYTCITFTTIGYGDIVPQRETAKIFAIFFIPLAVGVFGELIARIATACIQRQNRISETNQLCRHLTLYDLKELDTNQDGMVDKEEFVAYMLVHVLKRVDGETIEKLRSLFSSLDVTGNGVIDKDDVSYMIERQRNESLRSIRMRT